MSIPFGRVITAMVTPFTQELKVDYDRAAELALRLVDSGSDALVVSGTTGESPTLTKTEKIELFKVVAKAIGDKAKVIAGTGSYCTEESVELSKEAEKIGVDGLLLVVPYYNKPPQEGLYQHFATVARATSLPIMLYNIPGRTGVNMLPETTIRLSAIPNILATKEASGSMDQVGEIVKGTRPEFAVYSGDDSLTLPILSVGGAGIVSVASHLAGNKIAEMIQAYFSGDTSKATQIHLDLMPLFKGLFITANPIPVKAALEMVGFSVGGVRLPLVAANAKEVDTIRKMLISMGLL